jgi:LacI family transcriptional regulator
MTILDVAAANGVSIGTVSRVIVGSRRLAVETRARAMRTQQTKTIGFLIPNMTSQAFARVA